MIDYDANARPAAAANGRDECVARLPKITVNAAFFEEIKRDHFQLQELLLALLAAVEAASHSPHHATSAHELLRQLQNQLAFHFALEEAYGYFSEPLEAAPHLCSQAARLRDEHHLLRRQLEAIVDESERFLHQAPEFGFQRGGIVLRRAARIRQFCVCLREHERRECDLIQQAFQEDIGVGD